MNSVFHTKEINCDLYYCIMEMYCFLITKKKLFYKLKKFYSVVLSVFSRFAITLVGVLSFLGTFVVLSVDVTTLLHNSYF